jgi:basic membrane protein A
VFITILGIILASCSSPAASTTASTTKQLKVALVHYGVFTDQSWGQGAYEGFMKAVNEKNLAFATTEMLPQSDWESAFREYAAQGFDLVIGTDAGMDAAAKVVAADFPNTFFLVDSGRYSNGVNAGALAIAEWQEGILGGTVMANLTKAKKIGFIGGTDDPVIVAVATGIKSVAQQVDPSIEVQASYVGSWTDVQKAKELASAMLDAGVDIIMPKADAGSVAAIQLAAERGVLAVGSTGDMTSVAPDFVVASARAMNDVAIYKAVILFAEGNLKPEVITMGAKEGVVDLVWNPKFQALYPDLYTKTQQVLQDLISGKITEPVAP